uniref:SRCR domain-containing protein n=1 Tax=Sphenodon punctatus TaxID=8508 RepID=A0A8D0LAF8_SPHPU
MGLLRLGLCLATCFGLAVSDTGEPLTMPESTSNWNYLWEEETVTPSDPDTPDTRASTSDTETETEPPTGAKGVGEPQTMIPRASDTPDNWTEEREGRQRVRLVGGPGPCAGRVEIQYQGSWGTVCDDGWDLTDVAVVCRELDCGEPLGGPGSAHYGQGFGPIWLDDVNCTGDEASLSLCHFRLWGKHDCSHREDASAICIGEWPIRLQCSS